MTNVLGSYENGTYKVFIYEDGTKIRMSKYNEFVPDFPESIDLNITNKCSVGCEFCYIDSKNNAMHCDFDQYKELLDSIHPYTELAINGNDLDHPQLDWFLRYMKDRKVIVNVTVNEKVFLNKFSILDDMQKENLIHGIGISCVDTTPVMVNEFIKLPNTVCHVVLGLKNSSQVIDSLKTKADDIKILFLGFKKIGRGVDYYNENQVVVDENISDVRTKIKEYIATFKLISFDNLAIEQLRIQDRFSKKEWTSRYMGNDAEYTFYIDLVSGEYGKSSLVKNTEMHYIQEQDVNKLFESIRAK